MIKYNQNLHTHSTFCDGKNSPEDIIKHAIEIGFDSIGISSHSEMYFNGGGMSELKAPEYKTLMRELAEKYSDRINVYCGLEFEMYSKDIDFSGYDYIIGSSHYFRFQDNIVAFDRSIDVMRNIIAQYFGGDSMAFANKYYEDFSKLRKYGKFDIVGHFDLVAKHVGFNDYLDEQNPKYVESALDCLHELSKDFDIFEVNTGCISRGYRATPYPNPFILKEMAKLGKHVIISSDCHNMDYLDCHFENAVELIKSCGFNEVYVLTPDGFKGIKI